MPNETELSITMGASSCCAPPPAAAAIKAVGGAIFKIQLILNHPSPARRQCNLIRLSATLINGDERALDMFTCAKDLFFGPQSFLGRFPRRIE